jgi:hypothetical protein
MMSYCVLGALCGGVKTFRGYCPDCLQDTACSVPQICYLLRIVAVLLHSLGADLLGAYRCVVYAGTSLLGRRHARSAYAMSAAAHCNGRTMAAGQLGLVGWASSAMASWPVKIWLTVACISLLTRNKLAARMWTAGSILLPGLLATSLSAMQAEVFEVH